MVYTNPTFIFRSDDMSVFFLFGTRFATDSAFMRPVPQNDNETLMPEWMTPAELFQWIRRTREEMRRELAADPNLLTSPTHRQNWQTLDVLESAARRRYCGVG
jgi:hypothetical protein